MAAVQHMVLLKFKADVSQQRIDEIYAMLAGMQDKIDGITHYSGGRYSSPEGFNRGFTHGFLVTFESVAARDNYLPHPDHEPVKNAILETAAEVIAFDFEV